MSAAVSVELDRLSPNFRFPVFNTSLMVNFHSLPDAPITDEPFNPFWQPRYPAADFIEWTVKTVEEEDRDNEILGLNSVRMRFYKEFPSYRHKIHAASVDFDSLFIDSSFEDSDSDSSLSHSPVSRAMGASPSSPVHISAAKSPSVYATEDHSKPTLNDVEKNNRSAKRHLVSVSADNVHLWDGRSSSSGYRELCGTPQIVRSDCSQSETPSPFHARSGIEISNMNYAAYSSSHEEPSPQTTASGHHSTLDTTICGSPTDDDLQATDDARLLMLNREYIAELEGSLYGPYYGPCNLDSVDDLICDLDNLLPCIRLKKNLDLLYAGVGNKLTFQALLDYLSQLGQISSASLNLFRALDDVTNLDLRESLITCALVAPMSDTKEVLAVLSYPNSFPHLTELILSNVPLHDEDLVNLCRLSSLDTLGLANTCIGNEAITYLIPLKSTLACLNISSNPRLTDDSCTLLNFLTSLSFIDIRKTSVDMPGLRRFAHSIDSVRRNVIIEVPEICIEYLSSIQYLYAIMLPAPLITHPQDSKTLTIEALRSNLVVHAQCNPNIPTGGSRMEMVQRLEDILRCRESDMRVLDVLGWRDDLDEELKLKEGLEATALKEKIGVVNMV